ncbi:MAG: hypothetical protein HYR94_14430 [Chloroflexi bacterium]|nr:hypothetical protein [Chloroflexota bacterium]
MSSDEILELELSLILIKYGERKVLTSLAKITGLSISELEIKLERIHQIEKKPPVKKTKQTSRIIDEIIDQHPQKAHLLKILYARFQNKSFLPELRDIKRLLNQHSLESEGLKSRNIAAPKVFKLLASLDEKQLEELTQQQDKVDFSSLGIISDEIMRHKG